MSRKLLYQTLAIGLLGNVPTAATPHGFDAALPPVFTKPFAAAQQQFLADVPLNSITPNTVNYGWFPQPPDLFNKPFAATEQQFSQNFEPQGAIVSITPQGFYPQPPDLFKKPVPVEQQQFEASYPSQGNVPTAATPQGWQGIQLEFRLAKPFPIADQQFVAFGPEQVPTAATPYGWWPQPPDKFVKPLNVVEQQFLAHDPRQVPTAVTPHGWEGIQLEARFVKPFPIIAQQHAVLPLSTVSANTKVAGWHPQPPDIFVRPFKVAEQQFQAWPVQVVAPFLPPGAGKRRDFPSYIPQPAYDAEPSKPESFRPVWDQPEPTPEPKPGILLEEVPRPVPLPPASLFAGIPQRPMAGTSSLLAPQGPMPAGLPNFDHLVPPGTASLGPQLREAQDISDALAVLKALGLLG